ncbi:MAG: AMP-binding protein [Alphaproteobacteria bacterium]|nr:AMP-binding protein [Alphaproteobacteria bacterium]
MTTGGWPSIGALLAHARRQFAGREAVVDGAERLDYRALTTGAARLASGLRAAAILDGARVAFLGDNGADFLAAYLGIPAAGLVLVPLNTRLAAPELRYILEDSGTAALIAGPGHEERAAAAAAGTDAVVVGLATPLGDLRIETILARGNDTLPADGDAAALGYMYHTSGTTGRPKGVMLSHANVLSGTLAAASGMGLHGGHTWLHAGPMFHLADAFAIWALAWLGGRHVTMRFEADAAIRLIESERITHTLIVPTAIERLADAAHAGATRLDGLAALLYGGAPMPQPILDKARAAFDCALVPTYGMTETSGVITTGYPGDALVAAESGYVGREAPLVDLALVDDDGALVADGAVGEVVVAAPSVMMGYWRRPDETASVLDGRTMRTGDLGRRH